VTRIFTVTTQSRNALPGSGTTYGLLASMKTSTTSKLRIGIVGAGTAGLASAIALAKAGHEVHVLEKHRALTSRGAGVLIQPQGVHALDELGVGEKFRAVSVPVSRLLGTSHRGWVLVDIRYQNTEARGVSRRALSEVLFEAALAAGASVHFGVSVKGVEVQTPNSLVFWGESETRVLAFDLVVLADGAASVLPAQAGLAATSLTYQWGALWGMFDVETWPDTTLLEQRYETTRKMFGLMPTETVDGKLRLSLFWSLPVAEYDRWLARDLEEWKAEMLALWPEAAPVICQITRHDQLALATYRHVRTKSLARPGLCVIGDAAHAMSPQLGLGTTLAVQDALHLASSLAAYGLSEGLVRYSLKRLLPVRAYQALSRMLTPCFQAAGSGLWRDVAFAVGRKIPGVSWLMYRSLAEPAACAPRVPDVVRVSERQLQ
jgi:2-polyprenyl-6-methoxyphenol hydroxylase-like FAD-dependent oxidoreductase